MLFYKHIYMYDLNKLLSHNDHPNIILYDCDNTEYIINLISNKKSKKIVQDNIHIIINIDYIIFDISIIKKEDINNFKTYINYVINKKNILNNKQYIIFKNIDHNKKIQPYLFSIIEKNNNKFLFFCNNNCKIYNKLESICLNIRYNVKKDTKNLKIISNNILDNYLCKKINYKKIKELSYILCTLNIKFVDTIKILINEIIDIFEITKNKKYSCIKFLCDIEVSFLMSYNKLIYYEYILLNIYNILFDLKLK